MTDAAMNAKIMQLIGVDIKDIQIALSQEGEMRLTITTDGISLVVQLDLEKYNILVDLKSLSENILPLVISSLAAVGASSEEANELILKITENQIAAAEDDIHFKEILRGVETVEDMFGGDLGTDG